MADDRSADPVDLESRPEAPQSQHSYTSASPLHAQRTTRKSRAQRVWGGVFKWVKGPTPPRVHRINPFLPKIQNALPSLLDRWLPKRRYKITALVGLYLVWLIAFAAMLHKSAFANDIEGFGTPQNTYCFTSFWNNGNGCGIDGDDCRPFANNAMAFRCPANCLSTKILNSHAVGAQEPIYTQLVIGGNESVTSDKSYRGDSFICHAALHAGIIDDKKGGCGVTELRGPKDSFGGSSENGITSLSFDSTFPLSFGFLPQYNSECADVRWPLLVITIVLTSVLSLASNSPSVVFFSIFAASFFHVGLASDPPSYTSYYDIVSIIVGRFLPASFVAFVLYKIAVFRLLDGLRAPVEKTVLWLGGWWVGNLTNYTFDFIPIQRLTPHDLNAQPGAIVALVIIVLIIAAIAIGQIWMFRQEGRLPFYLGVYLAMGVPLLLLLAVPGFSLRLHHYVVALLLIPGTAIQTRPSLLYQGILLGLFVNGVARWGFDSILQTADQLRGDGTFDSALPELFSPNITATNITLHWQQPPDPWEGVSVLINDVERHRSYRGYDEPEYTWGLPADSNTPQNLPYYFRLAYMQGSSSGDYTKAGTWFPSNRSWAPMANGPS